MKNLNQAEKADLIGKLKSLSGLTDDERASLIELLNQHKKYGLVWEDKPEQAEQELKTKLPILREVKERAIVNDAEAPNHILIEGDNLHALTALSYTHAGKIDVIYIDPPYNTGNKDFVYNDSFVGVDDEYRHSKWISFMEKRLKIAKRLLSERGVIFISIDDNEQANLKLLCDDVFGGNNFITQVVWERAFAPVNLKKHFSESHDYILCYAKSLESAVCNGLPRSSEANARYANPDNDPRGVWTSGDLSVGPRIEAKVYEIETPGGRKIWPPSGYCWRLDKQTFEQYKAHNRIWFGEDGKSVPRIKRFLSEVKQGVTPMTIWKYSEVGHSQEATKELKDIFEGEARFTYPKSMRLIKRIVGLYGDKSSVILDFFAGSGTTLHAVMELNKDGGHRQCILVTNNENGICENVTYERNKRVINGYTTPRGEKVAGLRANNLRYYKVKAVPRDSTIRSRMRLAAGSVDLLCIMENLYQEKETFGLMTLDKRCRYFEEKGRGMLVVLDTDLIPQIVEQLKQLTPAQPVHLYVYAPSDYAFDEEFEEVADKVELYPLPQPILNAYKQWLPKQDEVMIDIPDNYQMTEEQLNETGKDFKSNEE